MMNKQQGISAQVLLRAASGKGPGDGTAITARTIKEYLPSVEAANNVRQSFVAEGFAAGPLIANSFSITAPISTFERVFHTQVQPDGHDGVEAARSDGTGSYELPLDALPTEIKKHIMAVTFTPPPAFGPARSGP